MRNTGVYVQNTRHSGYKCSPSMFIERMNTFSAVLVPKLDSPIITARHNQAIIWREPARDNVRNSRSQSSHHRCLLNLTHYVSEIL